MHYFFEDLELPRLVKPTCCRYRTGRTSAPAIRDGTPNNIDVVRSLRALGRRIALGGPLQRQLDVAEETWPR
jgi:uncharacterized sporulation protein YeaH/YhbH (DUF444 family)